MTNVSIRMKSFDFETENALLAIHISLYFIASLSSVVLINKFFYFGKNCFLQKVQILDEWLMVYINM